MIIRYGLRIIVVSMDRVECDPAPFQSIMLANIKWKSGRSSFILRSCAALCAFTAILHQKIEITSSYVDVYADAFLIWSNTKSSSFGRRQNRQQPCPPFRMSSSKRRNRISWTSRPTRLAIHRSVASRSFPRWTRRPVANVTTSSASRRS